MLRLPVIALIAMAASGAALAEGTNLDVNFTATVNETTCNMKLQGGNGSDTDQTLQIGNDIGVRISDFGTSANRAGNAAAQGNFKIMIVECPPTLTSLKTKITGSQSGYLTTGILNAIKKKMAEPTIPPCLSHV